MSESEVKHVMFYAPLNPGSLTLCECVDGKLRVLRDDVPVPGCEWPAADHDAAVASYQKIRAALGDPPAEP
jgi:hypothetical protein